MICLDYWYVSHSDMDEKYHAIFEEARFYLITTISIEQFPYLVFVDFFPLHG